MFVHTVIMVIEPHMKQGRQHKLISTIFLATSVTKKLDHNSTVDLRKGIDGLATIIGDRYGQNPFEKGTLFLFCGKRSDRCKGLLWMGTGFLLLYKRFEDGRLSWPRNIQEAAELTEDQYRYLMTGLNPLDPRIKDVDPKHIY